MLAHLQEIHIWMGSWASTTSQWPSDPRLYPNGVRSFGRFPMSIDRNLPPLVRGGLGAHQASGLGPHFLGFLPARMPTRCLHRDHCRTRDVTAVDRGPHRHSPSALWTPAADCRRRTLAADELTAMWHTSS